MTSRRMATQIQEMNARQADVMRAVATNELLSFEIRYKATAMSREFEDLNARWEALKAQLV